MSWTDNVADKVSKNRQAKGENNGRAKLTINQVQEILKDKISTTISLGEKYKVDRTLINKIRSGKAWSWLSPTCHQEVMAEVKT